uniref:Uncharacterized protein n=1 Tax=Ananas comosus var. bracteatus TaxID=296719 RepID=A0A6V7QQK5_ANACO
MAPLAPLSEQPVSEEETTTTCSKSLSATRSTRYSFRGWFKKRFSDNSSDLRVLLSVAASLSPPSPSLPNNLILFIRYHAIFLSVGAVSSAEYIVQQFRATTRCTTMAASVKSMYAAGRVSLAITRQPSAGGRRQHFDGCFVMWQLVPEMWLVELAVSGQQVVAGSDGRVAWRHTPWLGAHAARGGVRPLRRALQASIKYLIEYILAMKGLDPLTIAAVFSTAEHVGEKPMGGEECFALKLEVDPLMLLARSDGTAETIKHKMVGYFSPRSGLLVHLEDSLLIRTQTPGSQAMYWETNISSRIEDYRPVDGVMIAHSGRTTVDLVTFGVGLKADRVLMAQMEEVWTIEDVVFNVPGLSADYFIPPGEVQRM